MKGLNNMSERKKELPEVSRALNNLSSVASFQTTLDKKEVEFMFSEYSGTVFCRGHLRTIVATPIANNLFKITSKAFA